MFRTSVLVALAATAALVLTGCGGTAEPTSQGEPVGDAPTLDGRAAVDLGPLPATTGSITEAGDLCRVVDADVARQALGHSGELQAVVTEISLPIREGIVSCSYRGDVDGTPATVLVSVQRYDAQVWGYGVTSMELQGGKRGSLPGADEVVFPHRDGRSVQVRVGAHQAVSMNGTNGRFSEDGLTRLAAVAATAAG